MALPNLGLSASLGQVVKQTPESTSLVELEATYQFVDDEAILDDGNPAAGDWFQVRGGGNFMRHYAEKRSLVTRVGITWFRVRGEPNIVQQPGDYVGVYFGIGFETRVSKHLSIGPEILLMSAFREDWGEFVLVPQLRWQVIWHL